MPNTPLLFLNKEETIPQLQKRNLPETFSFKTPLPFKLRDLKWGWGGCATSHDSICITEMDLKKRSWFIQVLGIKK